MTNEDPEVQHTSNGSIPRRRERHEDSLYEVSKRKKDAKKRKSRLNTPASKKTGKVTKQTARNRIRQQDRLGNPKDQTNHLVEDENKTFCIQGIQIHQRDHLKTDHTKTAEKMEVKARRLDHNQRKKREARHGHQIAEQDQEQGMIACMSPKSHVCQLVNQLQEER